MADKRLLDHLERWHNLASESNFVWFPFLKLKLLPHEVLSQRRLLVMTICFSTYFNIAYLIKKMVFSDQIDLHSAMVSQLYFILGFFVWFNLVTKPLWNRRANRLKVIGG